MAELFIDIIILVTAVAILSVLFSPHVRKSKIWDATVTPLASIIGSGFLVVAPLLWILTGYHSTWVLLIIVVVAYAIGSVIRFNIQFVEPFLKSGREDFYFNQLNNISYLSLGLSYYVSIAFYTRILSAFVLKAFSIEDVFLADLLTSFILILIGGVGYLKGFDKLESLAVYSVNIKISVIGMLLLGLFLFDWLMLDFKVIENGKEVHFSFEMVRKIFGVLLIVQGFEISRYIGHKYDATTRIQTMKFAQILSGLIYLVFIFLIMYFMGEDQKVTETAIIDLSRKVSIFLPVAVTIGAVFSQFSAAIADTVGCGGIITEYSNDRISRNLAYILITIASVILIWLTDIFEIINYASRMFAIYYFTQCLQAIYVNQKHRRKGPYWTAYFGFIGLLMLLIAIFGISANV